MLPVSCRVIGWGHSQSLAKESRVHPRSSGGVPQSPSHAYSVAICSMWSLSSLYCSRRESKARSGKKGGGMDRQFLL